MLINSMYSKNRTSEVNNIDKSGVELKINDKSGVGLGEYHISWVDKSRGQPHQKSIIV
jgi:hypothetical protein